MSIVLSGKLLVGPLERTETPCPLPRLITPQAFGIKLSPDELGAAIHLFDKDGDGKVSCPEFLLTFFRVGELTSESNSYVSGEGIEARDTPVKSGYGKSVQLCRGHNSRPLSGWGRAPCFLRA